MRLPRYLRIGSISFVALFAALVAGARPRTALREIATGAPLSGLVSSKDSSIVVIYDPGACFKCDSLMPRLLEWARLHPGRFAVVLTRRASSEEREQMALLRIEPAGVVERDRLALVAGRRYHAEVVLFVNGREAHAEPYDPGLSTRRALYAYLIEGPRLKQADTGDALRE